MRSSGGEEHWTHLLSSLGGSQGVCVCVLYITALCKQYFFHFDLWKKDHEQSHYLYVFIDLNVTNVFTLFVLFSTFYFVFVSLLVSIALSV